MNRAGFFIQNTRASRPSRTIFQGALSLGWGLPQGPFRSILAVSNNLRAALARSTLFKCRPHRTGPEFRLPKSCQQSFVAIRRFGHASHGRSRRFARRLVPVVDFLTTGEPTKNSTQQKKMKSRRNTFLVTRSFYLYFCSFEQTEPLRQRTPLQPTTSRRGRPPPFSQQVK